jgi:hypothetical protein
MKASRRQVLAALGAAPVLAVVGKPDRQKQGPNWMPSGESRPDLALLPTIGQVKSGAASLAAHRWGIVAAMLQAGIEGDEFVEAYGLALHDTIEAVEVIDG